MDLRTSRGACDHIRRGFDALTPNLEAMAESEQRIERLLQVFQSFADEADSRRRYWWSRAPEERLHHMEELRLLNYGQVCITGRLQRVLEIVRY